MPSAILDAFGRPATYQGQGGLYARTADDNRLRPVPPNHFDDYMALLTSWNWKQLVSESRAIGSRGLVAAALLQKADYVSASDWRPYFDGKDSGYGDEAEQLLEDTNHIVCTRGPRYDWATFWRLGVLAVAPDGGFFILLTASQEGWPLLQPIEAHRIGQRSQQGQTVEADSAWTQVTQDTGEVVYISTPYVGLRITNGIITNRAGAEVAYRVLGETPDDDHDVSARDMIHVAPPRYFSEGRPAPQIAPGLLSLLAVDLARNAQLDQQINDARLTLINSNATGKQDITKQLLNQDGGGPVTGAGTNPEMVERGQFRYIKNGDALTPFESKRPSTEWMNFDERSAATAIAATGWRLEMLDPTALRGAATRAFQDQINTLILSSFKSFKHAVQRCTRYRIAKFTQLGMLPDNPDFMKWGITQPPDFVVDRNSSLVDIALVRAGADSMPDLHRRAGKRSREVLQQEARYLWEKHMAAKQWSKDGLKIQSTDLGNLSQRGDVSPIDQLATAVDMGAIQPAQDIDNAARDMLDLPQTAKPPAVIPAPAPKPGAPAPSNPP